MELRVLTSAMRVIVGVALALVLAACTGKGTAEVGLPPRAADVEFDERVSLGLDLRHDGTGSFATDGGVVSMMVSNGRSRSVTLTRVDPVTDPGLRVTYLGHCIRAHCVGAGRWDARIAGEVARGLEGRYPVVLGPGPEGRIRLVFRLEVEAPDAVERLRAGCLVLRSATVTLDGGKRVSVNAFGDRPIAGVYAQSDALPGQSSCYPEFGDSRPPPLLPVDTPPPVPGSRSQVPQAAPAG